MTATNETAPTPQTAGEARALNDRLDGELRALAAQIRPDELFVDPGNGEWTLGENLAHIAEFPDYFAGDLVRWLDDPATPVGRTHEHPGRNAAIAAARGRSLDDLRSELDISLSQFAALLDQLNDGDLQRVTHNRRYGDEPLATFLDRYNFHHKAAHIRQLRETLAAVRDASAKGAGG